MEKTLTERCLECGEEMEARPGKKFCSESCKNRYHNRIGYERRRTRERTVNALYRNHSILEALIDSGEESAPLSELESRGFNAKFVSSFRKTRGKFILNYCFDICYVQTPGRIFGIKRELP